MTKRCPLPVLIVKPGTVSKADIKRAEQDGFILIIECSEPESVRFLQPPPQANISDQARAALELMRMVVGQTSTETLYSVGQLTKFYAKALLTYSQPKPPEQVKS